MKHVFLLSFILLLTVVLFAESVDHDTALTAASNWLNHQNNLRGNYPDLSVKDFYIHRLEGQIIFYVFDFEPQGFVMVAGSDASSPILGYSVSGSSSLGDFPPNAASFFSIYERGMLDINNNELSNEYSIGDWEAILTGNIPSPHRSRAVSPLLSTQWNQNYSWNTSCPADVNGPGGYVYAGCPAVAAAQVMNYWEHPDQGTGSHSYTHTQYGLLSANFGTTTYDWSSMSDTTPTNSIRQLLFHLGVATEMDYGPYGSGAYSSDARDALVDFFDYDASASLEWKYNYSHNEWISLLKEQLDNSYPLFYHGYDSTHSSGHAFNCDGYDASDNFHFNWGWSGSYDGYFNLNSLNPGSHDFSYLQAAIVDVYPASQLPAPQNLTGYAGGAKVFLSWSAPASRSLQGYNVYRFGTKINQSLINGLEYEDTDVMSPGIYQYYVTAVYDSGESGASNTVTMETYNPLSLPFSENFDTVSEIPVYWHLDDHIGNGQVWQVGIVFGGLVTSGNYAFLNSHNYGSGNTQNCDLITPVLDLTNYRNIQLSFSHYFKQKALSSTATLSYSLDNGASWTAIDSWTDDTANPDFFSSFISAVDKESEVRFKWNYTGTWGNYWCIDNIDIVGEELVIPPEGTMVEGFFFSHDNPESISYDPEPADPPDPPEDYNNLLLIGVSGSGLVQFTISADPQTSGFYYVSGGWSAPHACIDNEIVFNIDFGRGDAYIFLGDEDDPPLPVELSSFTANITADMFVNLEWRAESETNMLGYNVFRASEDSVTEAAKVNPVTIEAHNESVATDYYYVDQNVFSGQEYYYWLELIDLDLTTNFHGPVYVFVNEDEESGTTPVLLETRLIGAYPNPFNPETAVRFSVAETTKVSITVYNLLGQKMQSLLINELYDKGRHSVVWNGRDADNQPAASGIYFYRMKTDDGFEDFKKMLLLK
jgi:hypothetical protein